MRSTTSVAKCSPRDVTDFAATPPLVNRVSCATLCANHYDDATRGALRENQFALVAILAAFRFHLPTGLTNIHNLSSGDCGNQMTRIHFLDWLTRSSGGIRVK